MDNNNISEEISKVRITRTRITVVAPSFVDFLKDIIQQQNAEIHEIKQITASANS